MPISKPSVQHDAHSTLALSVLWFAGWVIPIGGITVSAAVRSVVASPPGVSWKLIRRSR